MNKKDVNKMQKCMTKLQKALDELNEYVWAFEFLLTQGDGAKHEAIMEWRDVCEGLINKIKDLEYEQIDIIMRN